MKKYLLFLLLSVLAGSTFGQDTLYLRYDEDFIPTDDTVAKKPGHSGKRGYGLEGYRF